LVQGTLSTGIKSPGNDATHPPLTSTDVKIEFSYSSTPSLSLHDIKKTPLYFYANEDVTASNCPKNSNILGTLVTLNISIQYNSTYPD
jgi:hypothetical protein